MRQGPNIQDMDTKQYLQVPTTEREDKYTASIELSNACRQFYKSRVEAAEAMKNKWGRTPIPRMDANGNGKEKNAIDKAMEKLRTEMASLMDQDLSLMKQLLTLNETIEDLKWQRKYYYSKGSLQASSCDNSDWSVSDTEMYESQNEVPSKYPSPSSLSLQSWRSKELDNEDRRDNECTRSRSQKTNWGVHSNGKICDNAKRCLDTQILVNGSAYKIYHGEQNSFDSGIHEPTCDVEIRV